MFVSLIEFQSTPPVKAATGYIEYAHPLTAISIHAAREGGDIDVITLRPYQRISIHAAREGGDSISAAKHLTSADFNPRRP